MKHDLILLREALEQLSPDEATAHDLLAALRRIEKEYERATFQSARASDEKVVMSTLLAKTSDDLLEAVRRAEAANRSKSAFLANMSHELRTPLNAIIGYTDLLLTQIYGDLNEKQRDRLQRVMANGNHLLRLINDILDLSKIEAGKYELHLEAVPVREMLENTLFAVRDLADQNANQLDLIVENELGAMRTDRTRLKQILFNLLSNACKFTREGQVSLRAWRRAEHAQEWLHFEIVDSGIGIDAGQLQRIFDEFEQADTSPTRLHGGAGPPPPPPP
ncbi:MAG: hypothetical protein HC915_08345, partial [Anaerolineae bacterium]|nr:hypothetical protein [Anaerolineae bacterium]